MNSVSVQVLIILFFLPILKKHNQYSPKLDTAATDTYNGNIPFSEDFLNAVCFFLYVYVPGRLCRTGFMSMRKGKTAAASVYR